MEIIQISFNKKQARLLRKQAKETDKSIAGVVREAVDEYFGEGEK